MELVVRGQWDTMVCLQGDRVTHTALSDAVGHTRLVPADGDTVRFARAIGISFGAEETRP